MKQCEKVYERIATGGLPSRIVYKNLWHGVMVLLDPMPVAEGHLVIASLACAPSVDAIESRVLHNKLSTAAQYTGRVLDLAYPDAPYIGELTASNQIRHPHIHRVPGDNDAEWVKRFAKLEDWPRLQLSSDHLDEIHGRLTNQENLQELWQACDAEVVASGAPDNETVLAISELGIALPG